MVSPAPSDPGPQAPEGSRGLPPRSQLPRGVSVPDIPALGTTWYERRRPYWLRRLGMTVFAALAVSLFVAILADVLYAVYQDSPRACYVLVGLEAVFSLATGGYMFHRLVRHPAPLSETLHGPRRPWTRLGKVGAGTGVLARAGSALAGCFIVAAAALGLGIWVAFLLRSLTPVLPTERQARQKLAEQLRSRGYEIADE